MDLIFSVGREKGSVERVVDFPRFGEAELVSNGGEDFDDCEGSFMFWGELWVCNRTLEISGFQPDLVSFGKGGESSVVEIGRAHV